MKKLNKEQVKERADHATAVRTAIEAYNEEIKKYNATMEVAQGDVEAARVALNEKLDEVRNWCTNIVSDMDSYVSDRSDKWIDSDAGQNYESWKQEFENVDLEDFDELEFTALEEIDEERADGIDNLPEEQA